MISPIVIAIVVIVVQAVGLIFTFIHVVAARKGVSIVAQEVLNVQQRLHLPTNLKKYMKKK
jgi:hypothetical protein